MPNWDDFYDRDELAEQREQFGIEYDDGADPDEDDGLTTDDWDNWPSSPDDWRQGEPAGDERTWS